MDAQDTSSPAQANLSTCVEPPRSGGNAAWYDGALNMLSTQPAWPEDKERVLLEPYTYLESKPGKEIRSQLIDAFNVWLKVPEEKLTVIRKVVGMLHNSSLLMDDVEDNSDLRRGIPVAHKVYGVPQTINTANYVYFLVFSQISAMNGQGTTEMIVDEMINLHRGQGMDLFWRDSLTCPTEAEYVEMVNNKTGGLLRIAIKLMVAQSPEYAGPDLVPLVNLIGLLFQIRDDFMNLQSADYADNKGFCEDLTEGKFSFPIIHSIRASSSSNNNNDASSSSSHTDRQVLSILRQRPTDVATKKYAIEYMRERTASFAYTRDVMTRLDRLVRSETTRIEQSIDSKNEKLGMILDALRKGW